MPERTHEIVYSSLLVSTAMFNSFARSWRWKTSCTLRREYARGSPKTSGCLAICPSDGLSPIRPTNQTAGPTAGLNNNYLASVGTSTNYSSTTNTATGLAPQDTTGVFTEGGRSYGLQQITDGSSNTIAFEESLIGDLTIEQVKWRDGPLTSGGYAGGGPFYDASSNYNAVLTDLNACQTAFVNPKPILERRRSS
jgi:Protein of unknown function (DUF1559)